MHMIMLHTSEVARKPTSWFHCWYLVVNHCEHDEDDDGKKGCGDDHGKH